MSGRFDGDPLGAGFLPGAPDLESLADLEDAQRNAGAPALAEPSAGGPPVSADFVARTSAKVLADLRRIRTDASQVDRASLPSGLLSAYDAPEPSAGFVERVLAARRVAEPESEARLRRLLASYGEVPVSADFVGRTLAALRNPAPAVPAPLPSAPLRSAPLPSGPAPSVPALVLRHPRWRGRRAAAAAVVLAAAALAIALRARQVPARSLDALPEVAAATTFSPAALNTALERSVRDRGLRFEPVDPLLLLAAAPEGRAE